MNESVKVDDLDLKLDDSEDKSEEEPSDEEDLNECQQFIKDYKRAFKESKP